MKTTGEPCRILTNGQPVTDGHREIDPASGQQKAYVVLCESERAKGFVRPVRASYTHLGRPRDGGGVFTRTGGCGAVTMMGMELAETYARDPGFYTGTFCYSCRAHLPLDEFVWEGTAEQVGS